MTTSIISEEFDGFPFIDTTFNPSRLLTAVACCRYTREHPSQHPTRGDLTTVLQPAEATRIRRLDLVLDLPHADLTDTQLAEVADVRHSVSELIPAWRPLLDVPLNFRGLRHSAAVSSSNFAWPQHVFLADAAFASSTSLAEQVVHETSHQWLYFIEEMWPLQADNGPRFTLPSGTGGRSASELLGASHVVVNLHRLWTAFPADEPRRDRRLEHLHTYGSGCRLLLDSAHNAFTSEGLALAHRLSEELERI